MSTVHPQYIVDESQHRTAVVVPVEEWERIVEELEELDDIRAYDAAKAEAKTDPQEAIPFDQAVREIEGGDKA
jgi:hypothetical protein